LIAFYDFFLREYFEKGRCSRLSVDASADIASPHAGCCASACADRRICRTIGRSVDVALLHLVLKYGVSVLQAFFVLRHCRLAVINWTVDPRAGLKFVELQQLCGTKRGLACSFSAHLDRSHTPDQNEQENLRKSSRIVIS
jgi:hypothetical protein